MTRYFYVVAALCVAVSAAPPSPPHLHPQQSHAPVPQSYAPLDYNAEIAAYYNTQELPKQQDRRPERLENLEPDSEVELIPGAQQPQQPPQQNPVAPNIPGLVPGQRVYVVQMPVPGYRPGTIAGYQPVYIVAAAPQGNPGYSVDGSSGIPGGVQGIQGGGLQPVQGVALQGIIPQGFQGAVPGYQNAVLVNPQHQGQVVQPVHPFFGYPGHQAGLLLGSPLGYRGFEPVYQQQVNPGFGFAGPVNPQQHQQADAQRQGTRGAVQLSQVVGLHQEQPHPATSSRNADSSQRSEQHERVGKESASEEFSEEKPQRKSRSGLPYRKL